MNIVSKHTLNNGIDIPYLGLGTYLSKEGRETVNAVTWALEFGYRHFDTASVYRNEKSVGVAVRASKIPRGEIFITTKVWNADQGYDSTLKAFEKSLNRLGLDYVDLYLIHWPVELYRESTWKALEEIYRSGSARSIGVSNYMIPHLEEMKNYADIVPAVNQVEFNPFLYQKELMDYCNSRDILIEAYTPLLRGRKAKDPMLLSIAEKYGKTWAQILIKWSLEHNLVVLPKSVRKERIIENADIFDFSLEEEDMKKLDSINVNYRVSWDPSNIG